MDIDRMQGKVRGKKTAPLSLEICTLPVVILAQAQGGMKWIEQYFNEIEPGRWKLRTNEVTLRTTLD